MSESTGVSAERLKNLIEQVEAIEEEMKGCRGARREVYAEAKGEGFDVKILKMVVRMRRMKPDARAEQEELLEVYKAAVGM